MNTNLHSRWQSFRVVFVLTLMIMVAAYAFSQASVSAGNIQGTVTDPSGAVVPGAKVIITNTGTGQVITRTTNSGGAFSTGPLSSGVYKVRVEAASFQSAEQPVSVQVGVSAPANFKLQLGASTQTVEVTSEAVKVNTEQPTVQGVLTAQQIETLPVNGRNFLDLAQLEPGVQIQDGGNFDPTKNGFSSISFGGRAGRTARINVDGIDISDETVGTTTQNISAGAISEFQLSQSSLDLSTGLTSSGAVNIATKSGTNAFHGDGFYLGRNKPYGFASFPGDTPEGVRYQRNQMGGSFGGAIVKDHLFFFLNSERVKQDQDIALIPSGPFAGAIPNTYPSKFRDTTSDARLDWQGPHGLRVFYRFGYHVANAVYAYGTPFQPFANRDQTPAHTVGADFTSGKWSHSVRFGYFKFQNHIADAVIGNTGIYNPAASAAYPISISITGNRFGPSFLAPQATFQANHQIKYDVARPTGSHLLRFGVDYNAIRGGGFASFYGSAPYIVGSFGNIPQANGGPFPGGSANPLNYPVRQIIMGNGQGYFTEAPAFGAPAGGQQDNRFAFYVGDAWKVRPRFTLTYGVRYSRDTGRSDSDLPPMTCDQIDAATFFGQVPCTGKDLILDQFGGKFGGRVNQPNANFGPQVGFAWDPTGSGKTSIRGGVGLYYENAIFNNVLFDRPGRLQKGLFWGYTIVCPSASLSLPSGPVSSFPGPGGTVDIASQICGQPIGNAMNNIGAMYQYYQQQVAAAGPQANLNFLGETLANGGNSTGNSFIGPNYKTPFSIQMNIGVQHEFAPGLIFSADFLRNVGEHYLLGIDTNRVGDAAYLNTAAAVAAISGVNGAYGCGATASAAAIDCAITSGATIQDYASFGLDSGTNYLFGLPASIFGLTPSSGAAFSGINPMVGENQMLFPVGRSAYTGLELKLQHNIHRVVPGFTGINYTVSYSLSRFESMAGDQDFVNNAQDFRKVGRYFGPAALDRTHQLSFGGNFQIKHGPQLAFIGHFFSPLAVTPFLDEPSGYGQIFTSDLTGDGQWGDIVSGAKNGAFGRQYNGSSIQKLIDNYNNQVAGKLTPAGQALVAAGLMTQQQLVALGATAYYIAPTLPGNSGLSWLKTTDLKLDWPIKIGEKVTLHPNVAFYNLFNFANYDSASAVPSGDLATSPTACSYPACSAFTGSVNGIPNHWVDPNDPSASVQHPHDSTRVGVGTGVNTIGAPRQMEYGLRIVF